MSINARYSAIFDVSSQAYHIFGCGGIGSHTVLQLARMGANKFKLYDSDIVSEENVGVSAYTINHIGMYKTDALESMIKSINPKAKVKKINGEFRIKDVSIGKKDIAMLSFDSMAARMEVANTVCDSRMRALIDSRMGSETMQLYALIDPKIERYKEFWYPDSGGSAEPCNARATSYCASMAGSFAANAVKKIIGKQQLNEMTVFDFPSMTIQVGVHRE